MGGPYAKLTLGANLKGYSGSVTMKPGEALYCQDVMFRDDGAFFKHWGWQRNNSTAITARILAFKGFTYKGKNSTDVRPGNLGIANDGADWTKRQAFYSSAIILTETECRFWNPSTETWDLPVTAYAGPAWMPPGVSIDPSPKPTIIVQNDLCYIVGWADSNLKWDPTDRRLYIWGWDVACPNAGHTGVGAGGTLIAGATYRYRLSWINMFTGEESELSVVYEQDTTDANRTITLDNFTDYATAGGDNHYTPAVAAPADEDVGIVVYRAGPNDHTYYFLDLVEPDVNLAGATVTDNGLSVDYTFKADTRNFIDPPRLNHFVSWHTQWYGITWEDALPIPSGTERVAPGANFARVYWNDFQKKNSFWERVDVRNYQECPLEDGEILMAITKTDKHMIAITNLDGYHLQDADGKLLRILPLEWGVGIVGPKAWTFRGGWLYWLSDRGPYRWRPGLIEPDWIGKPLSPLFIDPETGLCQLTEGLRAESEVLYDPDARVVRFIFPCGSTAQLNRHVSYWIDATKYNQDSQTGWCLHSPRPQCMGYTHALGGLINGVPLTPLDRRGRFVFCDDSNYINEYEPSTFRGGLPGGTIATGTALAASTTATLVTSGGLYTTGDGMAGLRLEVVHTDGTVDIRTIASNTATDIVPTVAFSQEPDSGTWYVGGIPAYWLSWVDHMNDPKSHKDLTHMWVGYNRESGIEGDVLDVEVAASGEWPQAASRTRTMALDQYRDQMLIAAVGRYFTYQFANSRPDEQFLISYFETEERIMGKRKG